MDANRTRYHLLQGAQDWPRWRSPGGTLAKDSLDQVFFDTRRHDITLWPLAFRFPAAADDRALTPEDRRGAARDAFGNTYFISPDRQTVQLRSAGSDAVSTFWPFAEVDVDVQQARNSGGFTAIDAAPASTWTLQGLAVKFVKGFNHLIAATLATDPVVEGGHRVVFLSSDDEDAIAPVADLAKKLGFAPVKLGKLNEGGALVHARGRTWGQLIFQDLFKKEQ